LPLVSVKLQQVLMEATIGRGHAGLKMSHAQVLPIIGPEGARIHEIARTQHVSRQAISATSQDLEALGYLQRQPDSRDRRGVVLTLTSRGEGLIEDSVASLDDLERRFRGILGVRRLEDLQRTALDLYYALHLEAEIVEADFGQRAHDKNARKLKRGERDIEQLATRLRHWLGGGDAARLVAALEPPATRARRGVT
jgi:DNA-binding MarR family transcriptional regulator